MKQVAPMRECGEDLVVLPASELGLAELLASWDDCDECFPIIEDVLMPVDSDEISGEQVT